MANVTTSIRMDANTKKEATELLNDLGLDLSSAVNIFLRQVVLQRGLPFEVKCPQYRPEVLEAMEEARRISRDSNIKGYTDVKQMFREILEDEDDG